MSEAAARIIASEDPLYVLWCQGVDAYARFAEGKISEEVYNQTREAAIVMARQRLTNGAVIDRDGIRVYETDAGRYVAADRAGWVEGTYGTPEEAWTAGALPDKT